MRNVEAVNIEWFQPKKCYTIRFSFIHKIKQKQNDRFKKFEFNGLDVYLDFYFST